MEDNFTNRLNGVFEIDKSYENNNWLRVQIRTFAFGKNHNGSNILNSSLTNFGKARNTIGAVPIVAKYNDDTDNLEGHNIKLRKNKDDKYETHHETDALGFTSPTTNFHFEEVNEGDEINPNFKTYVVIEDVYLWKRFDATKKIIEWFQNGISPRVSMEIDQVEGQFDKEGYFQINDFEFTGIAALGTDVEPCFPKAEIQLYTVNEFKKDLKVLMSELNHNAQQGGTGMEDNKTKAEETPVVETDNLTVFEDGSVLLGSEEKGVKISAPEATIETPEVFEVEVEAEVAEEAIEEVVEIEAEIVEEVVVEEVEIIDYELKFNDLAADIKDIQAELDSLKTYKRNREEEDLQAKFADKLSTEEFTQVFTEMKESELDKVEEKLFALIGKKNFSVSKPATTVNKVKININQEVKDNPYGDFFN
jgi:hypothetical protein